MADLISTVSIAVSKMKMRWEEPYVSEAANKLMSSMPRGIYRGFVPGTDPLDDKKLRLTVDPNRGDSFLLCSDNTNGFTLGLREDSYVEFDATSLFPLAGDDTWYVWAEIDYSVSSVVVGKYHLTDTVPTGNFVRLLRLDMVNGDPGFDSANYDEDWADRPEPTKNKTGSYSAGDIEYGLLSGVEAWRNPDEDQKDAMDNATSPSSSNPFVTKSETKDKVMGDAVIKSVLGLSGDTEFQIMGWFYVGKGTNLEVFSSEGCRACIGLSIVRE